MPSKLQDTRPGEQCPEYDEDDGDGDDEHLIQITGSPDIVDGKLVIRMIGQCKCGWNTRKTIR
jgi:hypothetical protein